MIEKGLGDKWLWRCYIAGLDEPVINSHAIHAAPAAAAPLPGQWAGLPGKDIREKKKRKKKLPKSNSCGQRNVLGRERKREANGETI